MFTKKYALYFLRNIHGTYTIFKVRRTNKLESITKMGNKNFKIDLEKPLYISGKGVQCFFMDVESGNQLVFNQIEHKTDPNDLDIIVGQKIIRELTRGVMDNKKEIIMYFVLGFLLGGALTAVGLVMYYSNKINEMVVDAVSQMGEESDNVVPVNPISQTISITWFSVKTILNNTILRRW
jgi:hypothetical protein